jgi:S1-C subfamily serine protease
MRLRIGGVENPLSDRAVAARMSRLRPALTKSILFAAVLFQLSMGRAGLAQPIDSVQITRRIAPSVVLITGTTDSGNVLGSGFVVSRDGEIATNLHVIQDLNTGAVRLSSGAEFDSFSILAFDEEKDLAIIKVAGFDLPAVALGNSDDVQVGEPVLIVGNPLGLQGSVSAGIISSLRDDPFGGRFKTLQTDAAVSPGNSGGPVVNRQQEVIGVVVYRIGGGENLNFAVPINYVHDLIDSTAPEISLEELRLRLAKKGEATAGPSPQSKPPLSPAPSLSAGPLRSKMAVEGNVWFEQSRAAREVILRVYLSDAAFDIPFTIQ